MKGYCQNCGKYGVLHEHHVVPKSLGGKLVVFLCAEDCHSKVHEKDMTVTNLIRAGIARAKAQGIKCGRPKVAFDAHKAIQMRKDGVSLRNIAKELGVGAGTVYRALQGVDCVSSSCFMGEQKL